MISLITEIVVPSIVSILMFVLGTSLQAENFRTILANRMTIVLAVVAQLVLLPLAAVLISTGLRVHSDLAAAVLILAVCPGGAISNYYVYLARGYVALSIALTAVSTMLAVVTVPGLAYLLFDLRTVGIELADASIMSLSLRVLLLICLPVVAGMAARHFLGATVKRLEIHLRRGSLVLIALGVTFATVAVLRDSPGAFLAVAPAAMTFTVASWLTGMLVATLVMAPVRRTIAIELTVRNVAVAAAIGVGFVPAEILVAYLLCYFMFEFVLLAAYALWSSGAKLPDPNDTLRSLKRHK